MKSYCATSLTICSLTLSSIYPKVTPLISVWFADKDLLFFKSKIERGIGIPLAARDKLFDSFYRSSNVGTISGIGLGLAIVKKSVDLHASNI